MAFWTSKTPAVPEELREIAKRIARRYSRSQHYLRYTRKFLSDLENDVYDLRIGLQEQMQQSPKGYKA
ncbi:MAG: hypothetical protein JO089_00765 [Alphaproteobacteria bacterium]|nr:hypothetical protein [Alphaproteobacteria bacterium]